MTTQIFEAGAATWEACITWENGVERVSVYEYHGGYSRIEEWLTGGGGGERTIESRADWIAVWLYRPHASEGWSFRYYRNPGDGGCRINTGIPYSVCLDITLEQFIEITNYVPQSDGFVIDGNRYTFDQHIYWSVPYNSYWIWELHIDGVHLLSFEQTDEFNCSLTEVFRQ